MRFDTKRLLIRPLDERDFEDFFEYLSDQELVRMYFGLAGQVDHASAELIFSSFLKKEKTYALELKQEQKMIGHLTVADLELPDDAAKLLGSRNGITVAFAVSPAYQRCGIMSEALIKVIGFLLEKYEYIHCGYFDFNLASESLQKKFGFQRVSEQTVKLHDGEIRIIHNILTSNGG